MEESLNKQLKCGSHPHDRMSTGEGAETRSVSSMLRPAGGKQDGMGGLFVAKNQGFRILLQASWVAKQLKRQRAGSSTTGVEGCEETQLLE